MIWSDFFSIARSQRFKPVRDRSGPVRALPRKLFSMGKPTRKVRANKTLGLQVLVLSGFWAVMNGRVGDRSSSARAKGKRLGRPRVAVDAAKVARLRTSGFYWPKIARELGVSVGTAYQAAKL